MLRLNNFILIIAISIAKSEHHYRTEYFEVPLDHFTFANDKTFEIRYLINDSFALADRSSPIFIYLGNEADIEWIAEISGFIWEAAEYFNATIVYAEHRYYGKSLPFGDRSLESVEFSGYLTPEQALADYALLLTKVNRELRPVITWGGSYGGLLSTWFRMKYPHLSTGAIASSAPLVQFTTDCQTFRQLTTAVYSAAHVNCSQNIKKSWPIIKNYSMTVEGRELLNRKFKFCNDLIEPDDQDRFVEYLEDVYSNLAQDNCPYETAIHGRTPLPANPVDTFCRKFNGDYGDEELIDALQDALSIYSNYSGQSQCVDFSKAAGPATNRFDGSFSCQLCSELSFPVCSHADDPTTMFPTLKWNMTEYRQRCNDVFHVEPNLLKVFTNFGGDRLKYVSNILFSVGMNDPWHGGCLKHRPNDKIELILIENASHVYDFRASHPNDPETVRVARNFELATIAKWLAGIGTDYY